MTSSESVHTADIERRACQLIGGKLCVFEVGYKGAAHVIGNPVEVRQ